MIWIDVLESSLLGFRIPASISPQARQLQCSDPRIMSRWTQFYKKYILDHKLHIKAYNLERLSSGPLTKEQQKQFNSLMKEQQAALNHADKRCQKICAGGVPCSPAIQVQRNTIEVWEAVCKKKLGRTYSTNRIQCLAKKQI